MSRDHAQKGFGCQPEECSLSELAKQRVISIEPVRERERGTVIMTRGQQGRPGPARTNQSTRAPPSSGAVHLFNSQD